MAKTSLYLSSIFFLLSGASAAHADSKNSAAAPPSQNQPVSVSLGEKTADNGDPYAELEKLRRDFNRLFQQGLASAGRGLDWAQAQGGVFNPRMDLVEETDRYWVKVDLPGVSKEKLDVKVTDKTVTISGERSSEIENADKAGGVYQRERSFGRFERTIPIPDNVQKDKITAKYDLGVLSIDLPKINPTAPEAGSGRKIQIQ